MLNYKFTVNLNFTWYQDLLGKTQNLSEILHVKQEKGLSGQSACLEIWPPTLHKPDIVVHTYNSNTWKVDKKFKVTLSFIVPGYKRPCLNKEKLKGKKNQHSYFFP